MTAQSPAVVAAAAPGARRRPLMGFRTFAGKELREWTRGPGALIILGISVAAALFLTVIPFIAEATHEASEAGLLSHDPTANVLLGWTGGMVPLIAVLATMALLSAERDRGTLAWSLTNPVSPTSIITAKYVVATLVLMTTAIIVPMLLSSGLSTVVYGGPPDFRIVGTFGVLFLAVPTFYVALTVAVGTAVKSTVGVAAVAFAVMFVPQILGGLLPVITELSPTSIGTWAMSVAKGQPASILTPLGWLVSMAVLVVGAKLVFDRQEL
jgi:ABC-type transport system involved in multi-copper enzyme maturation permease subunit